LSIKHEENLSDTIKVQDEVQIIVRRGPDIVGHRSGGSAMGVETANDVVGDEIQSSLRGRPSPGEHGTVRAAALLMQKLNSLGGDWKLFDRSDTVSDVDVEFRNGRGDVLRVQHTRAADHTLFAQLARLGATASVDDAVRLADALLESVRRKSELPPDQKRAIVLLLDAIESPAFAFGPVVDRFHERHVQEVKGFGFAAVWLVGPVVELVHRIDA
jgi:hypothetical protein